MNRFKHSGAFGDLVYSLPIVRYLGGGEFYLHLDQLNWIGQHYYGSQPDPMHRGRLNWDDLQSIRGLLLAQSYITLVDQLGPNTEITHNLDRFRPFFVNHPSDYISLYATVFKITDPLTQAELRNRAWLTVPQTLTVPHRPIVINRTSRWLPPQLSSQWRTWQDQGWDQQSIFLGLAHEYDEFVKITGWRACEYQRTDTVMDMAKFIAGADTYIGNQSVGLALAIGLGQKIYCEYRRDLPMDRNECVFAQHPRITYF